jgi:hypothetical protein
MLRRFYAGKKLAPQVGFEPTTLRLTAVRVKTLSAVSSVAYGEHIRKSRPQLGYMGYTPALATFAGPKPPAAPKIGVYDYLQISMTPHSAESLVRLLVFVGGVASTIVGSWASSKIRIYDENRKAHLEDIKQKVLIPLSDDLAEKYVALVTHRSPAVVEYWGVRERKENVSVTVSPNEHGPLLGKIAPNILASTDQALYTDAKKKHFRDVINNTERFLAAWDAHADECCAWVHRLAEEILAECKLPTHPVSHGSPYVMPYRLGVFIYRRLFRTLEMALFKRNQNPGWVLEGFEGNPAAATEQELDSLLVYLDGLMARERSTADRLLRNARVLEQGLTSLRRELNYATAARRLRHKCDLVPFF